MPLYEFCFYVMIFCLLGRLFVIEYDRRSIVVPKNLLRLKRGFEKGKPNRRFWNTMRAHDSGFDVHYRKVPGRMTCTVLPLTTHGEDVWQLRIGLKETANSKPNKYVSIPVYSNGQIYEH